MCLSVWLCFLADHCFHFHRDFKKDTSTFFWGSPQMSVTTMWTWSHTKLGKYMLEKCSCQHDISVAWGCVNDATCAVNVILAGASLIFELCRRNDAFRNVLQQWSLFWRNINWNINKNTYFLKRTFGIGKCFFYSTITVFFFKYVSFWNHHHLASLWGSQMCVWQMRTWTYFHLTVWQLTLDPCWESPLKKPSLWQQSFKVVSQNVVYNQTQNASFKR